MEWLGYTSVHHLTSQMHTSTLALTCVWVAFNDTSLDNNTVLITILLFFRSNNTIHKFIHWASFGYRVIYPVYVKEKEEEVDIAQCTTQNTHIVDASPSSSVKLFRAELKSKGAAMLFISGTLRRLPRNCEGKRRCLCTWQRCSLLSTPPTTIS